MIRYLFIACLCCGLSVFGSDPPADLIQYNSALESANSDSVPKDISATAISTIHAEEINYSLPDRISQGLQGKVPGLLIMHNSDHPGKYDYNVSIWGNGTPLIVIDGVVREGIDAFLGINASDIEHIRVLKNNAAVIYGSRGTNGVIEVNTKKGNPGKPEFRINSSFGMQNPTHVPRMANAFEYATMVNRARTFQGLAPAFDSATVAAFEQGLPGAAGTNWYAECFKRMATRQSHHLSVSGGSERVTYYAGVGISGDDGLLRSEDLGAEKLTFRTHVQAQISQNLSSSLSLDAKQDHMYAPATSYSEIFKLSRLAEPTASVYANDDQRYFAAVSPLQGNPVASSESDLAGKQESLSANIHSAVTLQYSVPFLKGLSFNGRFSAGRIRMDQDVLHRIYPLYSYDHAAGEFLEDVQNTATKFTSAGWYTQNDFQLHAKYSRTFSGSHAIQSVVGYQQDQADYAWNSLTEGYVEDQGTILPIDTLGSGQLQYSESIKSFLGHIRYGYKERYIMEISTRIDKDLYSGTDWSSSMMVAGAWRMSEEDFLKDRLTPVSEAKLIASYGTTWGRPVNKFYTDTIPDHMLIAARNLEIGIDLGLWENTLALGITGFQKVREGILGQRIITGGGNSGDPLPEEDQYSNLTRGFESWVEMKGEVGNFSYRVGANFNLVRTMHQHITEGPFDSSYDRWRYGKTGRYDNILWGFVVEGRFQDSEELILAPPQNGNLGNIPELPGDFRYKDLNGDGIINANDMQPLFYNGNPVQYYGVSLSCNWKGFDLSAVFQGAAKYTVRLREIYGEMFYSRGNLPAMFYDSWTAGQDGTWNEGTWPANRYVTDVGAMYRESGIWRRSASFVRLKNIVFGYTFPGERWISRLRIDQFRIFAHGYNLFTLSEKLAKELDPEKKGIYTYPVMKSINVGLNVTF